MPVPTSHPQHPVPLRHHEAQSGSASPAPHPEITMSSSRESRPCMFISGAAVGIGRATARLFAARGWYIGMGDIDEASMAELVTELGPENAMAVPLDVRSPDDWHAALAAFHTRTGRLDLLVNNAGILISGPLQDNTLNRHNAQIDINVKGVLYGCHAGFAYLAATPGAQVINLASSAAFYGQASLANYSATKFYVRGLTEALNIEWQDHDIRVRDIMPLFVRTALVDGMNAQSIRRLGVHLTPEDVAAVVWKASQHPGWGKVHWPVGAQASILYKLTAFTPDWLNRLVARRIAV